MQSAADSASSGMVSVLGTGLTEAKVIEMASAVTKTTNSKCYVSNILCLGNIVVSGSTAAMEEVTKKI
jgi:malonyl CoA-acyl carrier protein transacylase